MTHHQILLVKRSWSILQKIEPVIVADVFYSKLFTDRPSLRTLFPEQMDQQYIKLIDMINMIIARLDHPDTFREDVAAMARRHSGYGVKKKHYTLVGAALLWTLEKGLGKDWTIDIKEAWVQCYTSLADIMIKATGKQSV